MAQAMKTIGAVLNEASEANMRDMESNRRSALTSVQLKGQVADQRYQEEQRGREREYLEGVKGIYNEEMFVKKPVSAQPAGAIPTPDADGNFPAQQFVTEAIDPSSRQGMEAISRVQMRTVALRQKLGLAKPEEVQGLVDFRRKVEAYGVADDFKRAFGGDADAVKRIADQFKLEGLQSVQSGQDEMGFLNIFAVSTKPDGTKTRVPIGHLAAAFSPEIEAMMKGDREAIKAKDERLNNEADRRYKSDMGAAALKNAETNSSRASKKMSDSDAYRTLSDLESKNAGKYLATGFTIRGPSGKAETVPDDGASGLVHQFGAMLIEQEDFSGGRAHVMAREMVSNINQRARSRYDAELKAAQDNLARLKASGANRDEVRAASQKVFDMEDNGVAYWQQYRQDLVNQILSRANGSQQGE